MEGSDMTLLALNLATFVGTIAVAVAATECVFWLIERSDKKKRKAKADAFLQMCDDLRERFPRPEK